MTPHNRILILVGGAAVMASLTIGIVFIQTNAADASLHADEAAAHDLARLGDRLLTDLHEQREAVDEYLLFADPRPLARYQQAAIDESATAIELRAGAQRIVGLSGAIAAVTAENDAWRASVAEPAIAAKQRGSIDGVRAALENEAEDLETSQSATIQFVTGIDAIETELSHRSDALNSLRVEATVLGVGIELLAAGLSLWFVRRYGLAVARDARRRTQASAERIEIIASLRILRMQASPEATAEMIAAALQRLPGIDVAAVLECSDEGVRALAVVGLRGFPIQSGETLPPGHAAYLMNRSAEGPWAERVTRPTESNAYHDRLQTLGIKSRAFAPIRANGVLIGLIALATADEDHGRHLIEDLPAVGEFASVAETILAPALVARRDRVEKQHRISRVISATAFSPVFQPVVQLDTGAIVGFEALTRFADGSRPDLTFAAARDCGTGIELETVTLQASLREGRRLPPGTWLSLNVSPALLAQGDILIRILADSPRPIVLEVTEHESVESYAPLRDTMVRLGPGVRLAVDDAGAGIANFSHLMELRPDFVKIDAGLVRGVDADPRRRAVVVGLIHFAAEAGCQVIAEGIETEAERTTVADLGVTLGQGFLLARPAPATTWSAESRKLAGPTPRALRVLPPPVVPRAHAS